TGAVLPTPAYRPLCTTACVTANMAGALSTRAPPLPSDVHSERSPRSKVPRHNTLAPPSPIAPRLTCRSHAAGASATQPASIGTTIVRNGAQPIRTASKTDLAAQPRASRLARVATHRRLKIYLLVAAGLLAVVVLLGGIRGAQIGKLIGMGKKCQAMGPPPESVGS